MLIGLFLCLFCWLSLLHTFFCRFSWTRTMSAMWSPPLCRGMLSYFRLYLFFFFFFCALVVHYSIDCLHIIDHSSFILSPFFSLSNRHVSSNNMLSAVFMRDTTSNAAVAQWGCTAIYYIARGTCICVAISFVLVCIYCVYIPTIKYLRDVGSNILCC